MCNELKVNCKQKKVPLQYTFCSIFAKYSPIFRIFLLSESVGNCLQSTVNMQTLTSVYFHSELIKLLTFYSVDIEDQMQTHKHIYTASNM